MKLRFDAWMEHCLYDPERGYYARRVEAVGKGGDFTTTPELTPALGTAVAAQIKEEWAAHGKRLPLIELGAGTGALSAQVRKELGWKPFLKHGIVEVSAGLRERQQERLGKKVSWYSSITEALKAYQGEALIFSNEFVDAFPVRIFKQDKEGWRELYLEISGDRVEEKWEETEGLPESTVFSQKWPIGQRVEVHDSYAAFLKELKAQLRVGSLLTVDYGEEAAGLYERRPSGSIRAYFLQQRLEGHEVYGNMGRQDLTADVNFSDLLRWTPDWQKEFLLTQAEFLKKHTTHKGEMINPLGAGQAFKVLLQRVTT